MLSIIISSYQEHFYTALEKNIAETIGIPYEIIKIDNPNLMGICEAYNKGASLSKYDYLLFVHEDVIFHTKEWGQKLINHLEKENVGVVGVAGSNYVPKAPIGWCMPKDQFNFVNIIQREKTTNKYKLYSNISSSHKVFALDGVFMAIKKNVYNLFYFDENLKGFHGYDLDFSLRVAQRYKNFVISDILLEHFSFGVPALEWFNSNVYVRKKIAYQYNIVDESVEKLTFHIFLKNFFKYNKINFRNLIFTFKFLSYKLFQNSFFNILKVYLYYLINYNKKL